MTAGAAGRVFMFSTYFPPEFSGAAKQAVSLAKELRARGVETVFLTVRSPGTAWRETHEGFPVYRFRFLRRVPLGEFLFWGRVFLFLLRRRRSFNWLHSHGAYYTNSGLAWMAGLLGKKSVFKVSLEKNDLAGISGGWRGRLHGAFLARADRLVAISGEIAQEIAANGFAPERVFHCPNGVDIARFAPSDALGRAALRRELGLPEGDILFLYAGVVDERKNVGWLIEQWISHCAEDGKGHLVVVGPVSREDPGGAFFRSLSRRAGEAGLEGRMTMREYVERIEDYYRACDVFVLPSLGEGMPNGVLEAMACGLPVVATRTSGTTDLIAEGENGYLFEPWDAAALLGRLSELAADASRRERMSARARSTTEDRFSIEGVADRYMSLYGFGVSSGLRPGERGASLNAGESPNLAEAHRA